MHMVYHSLKLQQKLALISTNYSSILQVRLLKTDLPSQLPIRKVMDMLLTNHQRLELKKIESSLVKMCKKRKQEVAAAERHRN